MTISSMTGFASIRTDISMGSFGIDIRTVNSRFLDINYRIPDFLRSKEIQINQIISSFLSRGKVELTITFQAKDVKEAECINKELAYTYADAAVDIKKYLTEAEEPISTSINPCDILLMPGVITSDAEINYDEVSKEILGKLPNVLQQLTESRTFEGEKLKGFLQEHLSAISDITDKIKKSMPDIVAWQKRKLAELIENAGLKLNNDLLEQELIIFSQRIDIAEEINRLKSHVLQANNILDKGGLCGKKLDFLMQEFNRESNTIASKSINTDITNCAIELKVLIEQMREQVQNIE